VENAPVQAKEWLTQEMIKAFPLGVYKDISDEIEAQPAKGNVFSVQGLREQLNLPEEKVAPATPVNKTATPEKYRNPRLKMAGFGGQGILMLGLGIAQAGMDAGYEVSWIPSYGPEMRGGTANCHVNLSTERIGSPLVTRPTVLIAMNLPSLEKFVDEVVPGGLIITDASLVTQPPARKDLEHLSIPATQIADELGNTRVANMVILGAYIAYTQILDQETVFASLPHFIKQKSLIGLNIQAIKKGIESISSQIKN
jgi:2-oxoisovalerate ferredoxin oxidoreductase beta subunit